MRVWMQKIERHSQDCAIATVVDKTLIASLTSNIG